MSRPCLHPDTTLNCRECASEDELEAAYVESARLVKMLALADEQIKENVKVLGIAVEMLSSQYYCDSSPAEVLKHLITKAKEVD